MNLKVKNVCRILVCGCLSEETSTLPIWKYLHCYTLPSLVRVMEPDASSVTGLE